ncbi:MAG TPA: hypothetical protein VF174_14670 [Micromonosporaceae bacterium]
MTGNRTRLFLAFLVGALVMIFGVDGGDGETPTNALLVLSIAAGAITWYALRPQNSGTGK